MAAKDYRICFGMFNAYIAKTSQRNPNIMLKDRREITEGEIMFLIEWWLRRKLAYSNNDTQIITQDGEPIIELKLLNKNKNDEI
jgi:hypothetical protein